MTKGQIQAFQKEILEWYRKNKRDLPWRRDREPYHILISEVMLQQTQVPRVIPKYYEWLHAFPDLKSLAQASTRDVLLHWSGLGYNRRALYLQKLAQELVSRSKPSPQPSPKGRGRLRRSNIYWPQTEKELRELPGIGEYTARALLCFAFNKQVAVVDTNVRKVILTKFFPEQAERVEGIDTHQRKPSTGSGKKDVPLTNKEIQAIADRLLPKEKAYEWNQALMDYASMVLSKEKTPALLRQGSGRVKQSTFKDSDRFFRGLTIRILLKEHRVGFDRLFEKVNHEHQIEEKRYITILDRLVKDGLLKKTKKGFSIIG